MENKLGKQLSISLAFLAIIWILLLTFQVRLATRLYSHQKDLFAVKLNTMFDDAFRGIDVVDYNAIDSLVALSLKEHSIPYEYDLGVYSENNQQFQLLTQNADVDALLEKGFRYNLFRVKSDETYLDTILIHFPSLVKRFRLEKIWSYVVIFSLLILLLCCFINFFYIYFKHRKINIFREKMAHFITHEVKTPLTTINLSTQLLKDDSVVTDTEAKNAYLDVIAEETKVLEELLDEVLTVFRLQNMPDPEMKEVELHHLLKEVCKVHSLKLNECGGEVSFHFEANSDVVMGNYTHLFNAFSNLVDNAIKYRKDKLLLDIGTKETGNSIVVTVTDNGIGIKKENLPLIFEAFTRFNTEDAHYVKGFGLGLDYVKHIVEFHQGNVKVESELGSGTSFIVTLPLKNN